MTSVGQGCSVGRHSFSRSHTLSQTAAIQGLPSGLIKFYLILTGTGNCTENPYI